MTPCENRGWKVGDRFRVTAGRSFDVGSVVELERDDGTELPKFKLISGGCNYANAKDKNPGAFTHIGNVEFISKAKPRNKYFNVGDVVVVVKTHAEGGVLTRTFEEGDVAEYKGDGEFLFLTGKGKDVTQYNSYHDCFELLRAAKQLPLPFKPFSFDITTREQAELFKAVMHVHNKVADCSFFDLEWTPDREDVRQFMKDKYEVLDTNAPGWKNYIK